MTPSDEPLRLGGVAPLRTVINLADLGFVYRVSDQARAEIDANERRPARALQTAHQYLFR